MTNDFAGGTTSPSLREDNFRHECAAETRRHLARAQRRVHHKRMLPQSLATHFKLSFCRRDDAAATHEIFARTWRPRCTPLDDARHATGTRCRRIALRSLGDGGSRSSRIKGTDFLRDNSSHRVKYGEQAKHMDAS